METQESKKRKQKGIIITVVSHAIAIILFCIFGFDVVDPKPAGLDIEWAIEGVQDAGGDDNLENTSETVAQDDTPPPNTSSAKASAEQDNEIYSDAGSDVAVKNNPTINKTKTPPKDVTVKNTSEDNPKETEDIVKKPKVSDWLKNLPGKGTPKKGPNNPGTGKGDGDKTGIQGDVGGKGTAKTGQGGEGGDRWIVGGRKPVEIDQKKNNCNETGKVDVYIKIDRQGNVISAVDRGGTTQNSCLIKKAIEQAKAIKYAPSNTFNEGTITIDLGL